MTLKQRVEDHPVFFVGGLIAAAFTAGWATHGQIASAGEHLDRAASCVVQSLPEVSVSHAERMAELQAGVVRLETNASDGRLIGYDQERYAAAAQRVRGDIAAEESAFSQQLEVLQKPCR